MVVCRVIRDASFEKTARSRRCPALSVKPLNELLDTDIF